MPQHAEVLGKERQLGFLVEAFADGKIIRLGGENVTLIGVETMKFRRVGSGTGEQRCGIGFQALNRLDVD